MRLIHGELTTTLSRLLIVIALLTMAAAAIRAQTPAPPQPAADEKKLNAKTEQSEQTVDEKELKEKVRRLEQAVTELKGQLDSLQAAKNNPKPVVVDAKYDPSASGAMASAATAPKTDSNTASAKPNGAQKDGESSFEVYGFAMLDAGFQFGSNHPDWYDTVRPTKLPSFDGEFGPDGNTYFGVRQSRFGAKSSIPTRWGELKTIFEFELFGTGADAGQTTFRLRHAYGELGQFGAGQYWTVFGDTDAFPNSIEYWGPNGLIWYRNVQVRWMPFKGRNAVTIALERPGAGADQGRVEDRIELENIKPHFKFPDLTGNVRWTRDWGHFQVAGILRSIEWEDLNDDDVDLSGGSVGYGVSLSSALNFSKNDVGRFQFTAGKGIQNYFNDAPVDVGVRINSVPVVNPLSAAEDVDGDPIIEGVALPVYGLSAFLDHRWNDKFTTAVGYSMLHIDNSNGQNANAFRRGHYALANLLYTPVPNVMIGTEFIYGGRENFLDGFYSDDFRIQFAFKYNFSKALKW
jgi:hypothetical protein